MEEFPSEEEEAFPNLRYVNNLYIYPTSVQIKNAELLQIKVEVKRDEQVKIAEKVCFGNCDSELYRTFTLNINAI
jgi:hypothetical protein